MTTMFGLQFIELYLLEIINLTLAAVNYRLCCDFTKQSLKKGLFFNDKRT